MGFTSHQQVVMLGAPTSLASIMVIGPHHMPPSHTSEIAPKWASGGSTWFGKVSQESAGLSFCVLGEISPRRARPGGLPGGMRSAGTPPPAPAAVFLPGAGPWQEPQRAKGRLITNQL
jgi:hypothetical protein